MSQTSEMVLNQNTSLQRSRSLENSENTELLATLESFSKVLGDYGYNVKPYSASSLAKLAEVPYEKKLQIKNSYENWMNWITPDPAPSQTPQTPSAEKEIEFAKKALKHFNLVADESFWTTVHFDHVIEIYGEEMVQLYRSLNFFKYCGYSLLDISIHEWYVLWERPQRIVEAMQKSVVEVMTHGHAFQKVKIPKHVLRETFDTGDTTDFEARACHIEFQYIGTLRRSPLAPPSAFICTASGGVIARGEDAMNFGFI